MQTIPQLLICAFISQGAQLMQTIVVYSMPKVRYSTGKAHWLGTRQAPDAATREIAYNKIDLIASDFASCE